MSIAVKAARKSLIWLGAILVGMYGALALGVVTEATTWTPGLALDLAGGRTLILKAETTDNSEIEASDLEQAVEVIRRRIDATGVNEAEIATQGNDTIVVSLPGNPSNATIDLIRQSAQLQFRPVLYAGQPGDLGPQVVTDDATPEPSPSPDATASAEPTASASPEPTASAEPSVEPSDEPSAAPEPIPGETDASSLLWLTDEVFEQFQALDCTKAVNLGGADLGNPDAGHAACAPNEFQKLAMGPVELDGSDVKTASSGPEMNQAGTLTGRFEVRLEFTAEGAGKFSDVTKRLVNLEDPRNRFAIMLDGVVISSPTVNTAITNGNASITGDFTQEEAAELANQLKFGAIPLTLTLQSSELVSPTLGATQLQVGLIAGLIGMVLVALYALLQYRGLGLVTVGSLLIAGLISYGAIALLSWGIGYRLSLAGVAGLIIAIGITADSFVLYFERIKDELRDGRSLQGALDHGWQRARRTIIASDAVSLLAAVVLYLLAIGSVRGFAFTLGLTTFVDVLVVILFTHPIMMLLARTRYFAEGGRWSGLSAASIGRESLYKGRGRVAVPAGTAPTAATAARETSPLEQLANEKSGLTLAERKAAAAKGDSK